MFLFFTFCKYFIIIIYKYKYYKIVSYSILLDFCRRLSKKDKGHDGDTSGVSSDDEEFKQPFHHPFLVKERPNIVMNIRVSKL